MNKDMMNPRKLEEDELRILVADMTTKLPPEITLETALMMLMDATSELSDRITMFETSNLISIAAVMTKAVAAQELYATSPISVEKETRQ
jgi:hypothetical protein